MDAKVRVVATLSTLPKNLEHLRDSLDSLLAQSHPLDQIYLNIPNGKSRRGDTSYYVPEYVKEYFPRVKVLRTADYGPLTKLLPALEVEDDPDTIVITVDDDRSYHPDTVKTLLKYAKEDPSAAFGMCGWSMAPYFKGIDVIPTYLPWEFLRRPDGRYVDVLQAVCGNVYRRKFFPDLELLANPEPRCLTTDDIWIAGYLAVVADVDRVLIPEIIPSIQPEWKKEQVAHKTRKHDAKSLSVFNSANHQDAKCRDGVIARLGPWTMAKDKRH